MQMLHSWGSKVLIINSFSGLKTEKPMNFINVNHMTENLKLAFPIVSGVILTIVHVL